MWWTIKRIKKVIILQLNNVKTQIINLSQMTYGLLWNKVVCIVGNAKLNTTEGENVFNVSYIVNKENNIELDMYNLKYKTDTKNLIIFKKNNSKPTVEAKNGISIKTSHHTLHFSGSVGWYDWMAMNGYEDGNPVEFTIDIYDVYYIGSTPTKYLIHSVEVQEYVDWTNISFHVSDPEVSGYDIFGFQVFSKVVIIPYDYEFNELEIKVTKGYCVDSSTDLSLIISYLTTEQPDKMSTDIHLIAWEES